MAVGVLHGLAFRKLNKYVLIDRYKTLNMCCVQHESQHYYYSEKYILLQKQLQNITTEFF